MIFGLDDGDEAILEKYLLDSTNETYTNYLNDLIIKMVANSQSVIEYWSSNNSNFTNTEPGMARGGEKGNDSYIFLTLSVYKKITNKNYKDK